MLALTQRKENKVFFLPFDFTFSSIMSSFTIVQLGAIPGAYESCGLTAASVIDV